MAPLAVVGTLGMVLSSSPATAFISSSPATALISLVIFGILSITLLAVCTRCRKSGNEYDVSGAQVSAETGVDNGTSTTKKGGDTGSVPEWRDHKAMPANTLERAATNP